MAIDRQRAKAAIKSGSSEEADFENVLKDAKQYQLELAREAHRHKETSRAAEIGLVGRLIGADGNAAHAIALIVIVSGVIGAIACGVAAARRPNEKEFWGQLSDRAVAVVLTALGYIFGRSNSKQR